MKPELLEMDLEGDRVNVMKGPKFGKEVDNRSNRRTREERRGIIGSQNHRIDAWGLVRTRVGLVTE